MDCNNDETKTDKNNKWCDISQGLWTQRWLVRPKHGLPSWSLHRFIQHKVLSCVWCQQTLSCLSPAHFWTGWHLRTGWSRGWSSGAKVRNLTSCYIHIPSEALPCHFLSLLQLWVHWLSVSFLRRQTLGQGCESPVQSGSCLRELGFEVRAARL